jgi:uncharacterized protein YacL
MNKNIFKSTWAILVGFLTGAVLSVLTDAVLEKTGFMKTEPFDANPVWIIIIIIIYRCIYNTIGCYFAASLAPNRPMHHAMVIGVIGLVLTIIGLILMWDKPPHWYPIILAILTLPCAWLGGKLKKKSNNLK